MESLAQNDKRLKGYRRIIIGSFFLLAAFWPLGSFIFWIASGVISYFTFLSFYHQSKTSAREVESSPNLDKSPNTPIVGPVMEFFKRVKMIKPIYMVLFSSGLIFLLAVIIPNVTHNKSDVDEKIARTNIDSLIDQGNADYNRGQYEAAMNNYDKVLQLEPTNQYGLYNKALVHYSKRDYRKSISIAQFCVAANPDYGSAYYLIGDDYKYLNQSDSALIFFEKAYELGSRDIGLLQNLGDIYYDKQEPEDAIQFYKETIEQDSSLLYVYERLAELEPNQAPLYKQRAASLKR